MGEKQNRPFQLSSNASLRVDFQGSRVTSDGGLILVRELDERLGFGELAAECLTDMRAKNAQLPIADLLRQSVYSRLAGYEDVNDAERLAQDPPGWVARQRLVQNAPSRSNSRTASTYPESIQPLPSHAVAHPTLRRLEPIFIHMGAPKAHIKLPLMSSGRITTAAWCSDQSNSK